MGSRPGSSAQHSDDAHQAGNGDDRDGEEKLVVHVSVTFDRKSVRERIYRDGGNPVR